jgi:integrase
LASAAIHAGVPIAALSSLRALIDAAIVEPALNWLVGRFGGQPAPHLANIARVTCVVARHFLDQATEVERVKEERNLRDLRLFCANLQPRGNGMTRKNRELLNRFKNPELLARFVMLPQQLFARVASKPRPRPADARRAVLAVAIEILLHAPIRIQNLHAIRLDTHYKVYGQGVKARAVLEFAVAEVKNEVDLSYPLPASTAAMIDEFCRRLRPLLAEPNSPYLFPGRGLRPGQSSALGKKIADVTAEIVGVRITAHQFRHICALLYLQQHPGDYETVRRFLGHSRIEMTIRYYAGMEGEAAIALWDNTLRDMQEAAAERPRAKPRRRRN